MLQPESSALHTACSELGLILSDDQATALLKYLALLQHWNAAYNLTAVRHPAAMLTQHLVDCLALVPPLLRQVGAGPVRILDVGSGGGLPGVVLAIMVAKWGVTCVDAVGKKTAFVRQAAGALDLVNLHAVHSRVENLRAPAFDVITVRAFGSLTATVSLTRKLIGLGPGACWLAMKGKRPDEEIAALPDDIDVFHVEQLVVPGLDAQRCLVWMRPAA